tara:strand:- start:30 stop:2093 length:2064 start_codon:yes stop_codon:yes gene_type:complete
MNIYFTILLEFLLISSSILILFRLRGKIGLAPLYILLGAVQYIQAFTGTMIKFKAPGDITIYPGSVIIFCAVLFAVLLIYIKEGVSSARALIIGIIISNFLLSVMFEITYQQELALGSLHDVETSSVFLINYKYFIIGTIILLLDFILLVIIYQFLVLKISKLNFFFIVLISLLTILIFDAVAFNLALKYNSPDFWISLKGHIIGKSIAAFIFSIILYVYLKFIDDEKSYSTFIANQNRDIFSIITYRKRYLNLKAEKKQVEKKLVSQIESTLNHISDGFVSLDTNWCYTYVNEKAGEFLGRSPKSLIGKNIWTEFPDGVGLPFYNAYYQALETQKTVYFEEYYEPFEKWFENRIYPSPDGLTIYFTDISIQKNAELALKESEKHLDNIINNIGDPLFVKDEKSQFLLVNDSCCSFFNLSRDEIIGKTLAEDIPQEEMEIFFKIDKQVINTGVENTNEENLTVRDGKTRRISTKKTRFIDSRGNKFLIGTIRDITERIKAEKSLKESEEKFSKVFQSSQVGFSIVNMDQVTTDINEAMAKLVESTREHLIGKTIEEAGVHIIDDAYHEQNNRLIEKMKKNGYLRNETIDKTLISGRKFSSLISVEPIEIKGVPHILTTAIDITDKKIVEEELEKHRNNLEELVKLRTEEIEAKNLELQRINKLFVGRELKMKELKRIIKELQLKNEN